MRRRQPPQRDLACSLARLEQSDLDQPLCKQHHWHARTSLQSCPALRSCSTCLCLAACATHPVLTHLGLYKMPHETCVWHLSHLPASCYLQGRCPQNGPLWSASNGCHSLTTRSQVRHMLFWCLQQVDELLVEYLMRWPLAGTCATGGCWCSDSEGLPEAGSHAA